MIKYLHPEILMYLPIIAVVIISIYVFIAVKRRRILSSIGLNDNIYWHIIQWLKILSIIFLLIAASLPVHVSTIQYSVKGNPERSEIRNAMYNITALHVLIVDESKSMNYTDETNTTRFVRALMFLNEYFKYLSPKDRVLIIGFAEYPDKICIGNVTYCSRSLGKLYPDKKYSDLSSAIAYAYTYVTAAQYPAVIVIVSDGAYNLGGDPYDEIVSINKSGYPILFVRVGLDPRANKLIDQLVDSGIHVINVNQFTEKLLDELTRDAAKQLRLEAFSSKKLLEVKISKQEVDSSPTFLLLIASLVAYVLSRIEGF